MKRATIAGTTALFAQSIASKFGGGKDSFLSDPNDPNKSLADSVIFQQSALEPTSKKNKAPKVE